MKSVSLALREFPYLVSYCVIPLRSLFSTFNSRETQTNIYKTESSSIYLAQLLPLILCIVLFTIVHTIQALITSNVPIWIMTISTVTITSEYWAEARWSSRSGVSGSYHWLPVVTSGYQKLPVVTSSYQWLPVVTSGYQKLPIVTSGYQWLPVVTSAVVTSGY